jgi:hypothetical protein
LAERLVEVGLWHEDGEFFRVHQYEIQQQEAMKDRVEARREYERERKASLRKQGKTASVPPPGPGHVPDTVPDILHVSPFPSRPVPNSPLRGERARDVTDRELRGLGLSAARPGGGSLVALVAGAYGERYRAETGRVWLAASDIERIVRGNPRPAHHELAAHLDALAAWLTETPEAERDAALAAVLDGAWADPWMRERQCPLKRIATEPGRFLAAKPTRRTDAADWHPTDGPPRSSQHDGVWNAWIAAGCPQDRSWRPGNQGAA